MLTSRRNGHRVREEADDADSGFLALSPSDSLSMPAEWERQQAVWISYPHNPETWVSNLSEAQAEMQYLVHFLSESECVRINVPEGYDEILTEKFASELADDRVVLHDIPTNDAWCRDHGAIFVRRQSASGSPEELVAISWGFNAWGGKYPPFDRDDAAAGKMAEALDVPCYDGGMILEGGAIEVNGKGRLLTTESCLLSDSRNPNLSREEIEYRLRLAFGVDDILWLAGGDVVGDDTDGHIDNLARFVADDTILHVVPNDSGDQNYDVLRNQTIQLRRLAADANMRLVELPMPEAVVYDGVRLPASYGNFLITNEVVLLPSYGKRDETARSILRELFPSHQIMLIPSSNLLVGLGSIHCLTQQVPA